MWNSEEGARADTLTRARTRRPENPPRPEGEPVGDDAPIKEGVERGLEGGLRGRAGVRDEPARLTAELAARVRHEINNPLTGLIGQAQLLLRDETLSDGARRRVEVIEQLAKRIRDAVAELRVVRDPPGGAGVSEAGGRAAGEAERAEDPPRH